MIRKQDLTFNSAIRFGLQGLALCTVATVGIVILTAGSEARALLTSFPVSFTPLLASMICCSWLCTATRFWLLCKSLNAKVSYRRALALTLCLEFGIAASPGGVGGTALFLKLLQQSGVPVASATAVLVADTAIDLLFFALLSPFAALTMLSHPDWKGLPGFVSLKQIIPLSLAVSLTFSAALWAASRDPWWRKVEIWARAFAPAVRHHVPSRLRLIRRRLKRGSSHVRSQCEFLWRRRKIILAANLLLAAVQWTARYGILPCILLAFSVRLNPWPLIIIQALVLAGSFLLIVPGGGGSIEVVMSLILKHFTPVPTIAVAVLLWRFFTYHINLIVGGMVFFLMFRKSRSRAPDVPHPPAMKLAKPRHPAPFS